MKQWTLKGKKALITGGTKGIGLAIANELLSLGADVFIVARNENLIKRKVNAWQKKGYKAFGYAADLGKNEERKNGSQG